LIVAALYGQTEAARFLVDNGASVDSTNNDGATALHVAAFFCRPEMAAFLLEHGADVEARNRYGQTALETVAGEWNSDVEGVYNMVAGLWKLELNMERIRETRPQVAKLIRRHAERR
jgi:ankyrin repeat protein